MTEQFDHDSPNETQRTRSPARLRARGRNFILIGIGIAVAALIINGTLFAPPLDNPIAADGAVMVTAAVRALAFYLSTPLATAFIVVGLLFRSGYSISA